MNERQKRQKIAREAAPEVKEAIFDVLRSMTIEELVEFGRDLGYKFDPA